jgi:hypothetical protein
MLSREDFMFTIGYDGPTALIDGQAKRRYSGLSTRELAEKGLFRAAYCSALRSEDPSDLDTVVAAYNAAAGTTYTRDAPFGRLFGVFKVDAQKALIL